MRVHRSSVPDGVSAWIHENQRQWAHGGPRRHFGVYDASTGALVGGVEAHLGLFVEDPGHVNIPYAVFPAWRGRGIATRAVSLVCDWLSVDIGSEFAVIRAAPGNTHSHRVPDAAGFVTIGPTVNGEQFIRYVKRLRPRSGD